MWNKHEETGFRRHTRKHLLKDGIVEPPCGLQLCNHKVSSERASPYLSALIACEFCILGIEKW